MSANEMIYSTDWLRIQRSEDGGYIVWTRVHEGAAWRPAPIPKAALGRVLTDHVEREISGHP